MEIAIVGASGIVGEELLRLFAKRDYDLSQFLLLASSEKTLSLDDYHLTVYPLQEDSFAGIDVVFFCTDAQTAKKYIPYARKEKALVIDMSSAFRLHSHVPLIIPEINCNLIDGKKLISSPNCVVSILLTALYPLHKNASIQRITAATYQAASGGGKTMLERLENQNAQETTPYQYNLFPHESPLLESNYAEEEIKIIQEARKILGNDLEVAVTAVRVPVIRAHSIAAFVEFEHPMQAKEAIGLLQEAKGICYTEDPASLHPHFASFKEEIFCGRVKDDLFQKNRVAFWIVGDQLLKGAALNALQIYDFVTNQQTNKNPVYS